MLTIEGPIYMLYYIYFCVCVSISTHTHTHLLGFAIVEAAIAWADGIAKKLLMLCHVLNENAFLAGEN